MTDGGCHALRLSYSPSTVGRATAGTADPTVVVVVVIVVVVVVVVVAVIDVVVVVVDDVVVAHTVGHLHQRRCGGDTRTGSCLLQKQQL